ncbi:MAG: helix-turn-helix domain-containing protein [bacterium]
MKRYSDWQKYVKEQTDKIQKEPSSQISDAARKSSGKSLLDTPAKKSYTLQSPITQQEVTIRRNYPVDVVTKKPPISVSPHSSPAPAAHDRLKTDEKSSAGATSAEQQKFTFTSKMSQRSDAAPAVKSLTMKSSRSSLSVKNRDELIERLINPTISLEETAKIMNVCKTTLRRYTAKGLLPHYRTAGNQRRFKLSDVLNFMEKQKR